MVEISRKQRDALIKKGVKIGSEGILKAANYNRRYWLVETRENMKLLKSLDV